MIISRIVKTGIILTAMLTVGITSYAAPTGNEVDSPSNIRDYEGDWQRKPPFPAEGVSNTVTTARADGYTEQSLYLWDKDNVPARTNYTTNNGNYYDDPDFVPYVTSMLVPEDVKPKGAVLLCAVERRSVYAALKIHSLLARLYAARAEARDHDIVGINAVNIRVLSYEPHRALKV